MEWHGGLGKGMLATPSLLARDDSSRRRQANRTARRLARPALIRRRFAGIRRPFLLPPLWLLSFGSIRL